MDQPSRDDQAAIDLLKTARGQVDATLRMVEEDRNCVEVSWQVHASIALLKKANILILTQRVNTCVKEAIVASDSAKKVEEIALILEKYLER